MDMDQLVKSLAKRLEMPLPAPDQNGMCTFVFDGMPVHCRSGPNQTLILWGHITEVDPDPDKAKDQMRELLQANLAWMKARGEVVAMEPESGRIILSLSLKTADLDAARFEERMEGFVNGLEFWLARAKKMSAPAASPFQGGILP
jgi:hypothetical protein